MNDKLFDLNLITASDYTVNCVIKPEMYNRFLESLNGCTDDANHLFQDAIKAAIREHIDSLSAQNKRLNFKSKIFDV